MAEFLNETLKGRSPGDVPWSEQAYDFRAEKEEKVREFHEDIDLVHILCAVYCTGVTDVSLFHAGPRQQARCR